MLSLSKHGAGFFSSLLCARRPCRACRDSSPLDRVRRKINTDHMKASAVQGKTFVARQVSAQPPGARHAVARIKAGLPIKEFDTLRALLGLTVADLAGKVGISLATLSRRRRHHTALDPAHSDRILRLARLYRLAVDLYDGNQAAARTWLTRPARALDGQTPLDFADTEAGAREVEQLIGRLEHGVYA